ncbi:MAG: phosphoribosylformylglycinamidine synthase subunit PurL [Candidatus Zixiibacteriota bacterium]
MKEPKVTEEMALAHGLSREEYERIREILGRTLTFTELGIYSVMWSEHCSYKNSIALLKTLPRESPHLLAKAGEENAGAMDIGDGLAVVFKIESHNHPSAVEPYQGAATGIGGILRDIFTMGARPIACLDPLHFGELRNPRVRYLFDGVVRGIGDYGNCFGVPTVGGEVYFEKNYTGNPIVNCMAVGLARHEDLISATAKGKGNAVLIVGASTGRDGIHGATFASEELSEKSESRRPSVQIGDPFMEKLLLEATLEIIGERLVVGIQDMGAAGITCSTSEMSARGESGMEIELSKVPVRETKMTPYEIMLSESQERMLVVAKKGKVKEIQRIFKKWGLHSAIIGKVTDDGLLRVKNGGRVVAEVPAVSLALGGGTPVYTRERKRPAHLSKHWRFDPNSLPPPKDLGETLLKLLCSPNIASKAWVYEQYDTMVRTGTVVGPGSDAAVIRIRKTKKGLAFSTDCNGRYCYLNPKEGAKIAVAEAARNLVCSGAKPLGVTNCLNFGNPYKPEMFWTFAECVAGMGEACRAFKTPITGGNVSFYNEDPERAVYPTPVIGMVGLIENVNHVTTQYFKNRGDLIFLVGENTPEVGGSEYLKSIHNKIVGQIPGIDLDFELKVQEFCLAAIREGLVVSAHDTSEGGLAVALAECCIASPKKNLGAVIRLKDQMRPDFLLFGESQSRIILSARQKNADRLKRLAKRFQVPLKKIGTVGGKALKIDSLLALDLDSLKRAYFRSIPNLMEKW